MANFKEGARRIKVVGTITTGLGIAVLGLFFALPSYRGFMAYYLFNLIWQLLLPLVIGLVLMAGGWVLEGYSRGSNDRAK